MSNGPWIKECPEEEGMYFVNVGDVVDDKTLSLEIFKFINGILCDEKEIEAYMYPACCKFSKINVEKLNEQ